jgi:Domain of unknown function (DUF6379)
MAEGMVPPDSLAARDGRLELAIHLPWYRSLPVSCLESVEVTVDGAPAGVRSVQVPDFAGRVDEAASSESQWDLRDPLNVSLDAAGRPGEVHELEVAVAVRIPYIQQAPGVPLVQRTVARTEVTVR